MSLLVSFPLIKEEAIQEPVNTSPVHQISPVASDEATSESKLITLPQTSSSTSASTSASSVCPLPSVEIKVEPSEPVKFPPLAITVTPNTHANKSFNPNDPLFSNFNTPPINPTSNYNSSASHSLSTNLTKSISNPTLSQSSLHNRLSSNISAQKKTNVGSSNSQFNPKIGSNTSTSNGEQSELTTLISYIFSQPYLFFHTPNMHIPDLEASQDDMYTVFSFMVPNKPLQGSTSTNNSQLHKKQSISTNLFSPNYLSQDKQGQNCPPYHNNGINSVFHNSRTFLQNTVTSTSPTGFQKSGDNSNHKMNNKTPISSAQKASNLGFLKDEKKNSGIKGEISLADLIKQKSQPEEQKRRKSEQITSLNNLGGFKSAHNLGSLSSLPISSTGLSQSSINNLLNSLTPLAANGNSLLSNYASNPIRILQEEKQYEVKHEMEDEEYNQERVVLPDSNEGEDGDECDEEDEGDMNDENEEARLIREIKELKDPNGMSQLFAKNFKKDGGLIFGGDDNDDDFFDFCDEKFLTGGKKLKKNCGGSHKNKFDTKNLVKNFLNSFISFVHHPEEEATIIGVLEFECSSQLNDFRTDLRNFFKGKKFNRVLLREFIFQDIFRPLFLFFLENRALIWIESGRMKDKASHLRALKNFIFVCQNYDQIKSWRFRYNFVQN